MYRNQPMKAVTMNAARRVIDAHTTRLSGHGNVHHPSYQRLAKAASILRGIHGESELAKAMRISDQQRVNNWQRRGVSKDGALDAERYIGCPATWIIDGEFPAGCSWEKLTGQKDGGAANTSPELQELTNLARTLDEESLRSLNLLVRKLQNL